MDRLTWDRFAPRFSPSLDNPTDPVLAFHWLVEAWMLRVRWVAAPL